MADHEQQNEMNTQKGLDGIWQSIRNKYGQNPSSSWILIAIAALGVILLITGNDKPTYTYGKVPPEVQQNQVNETRASQVDTDLAGELSRALAGIDGAGRVRVKVNLKSRSRKIWERQIRESKRTSQEQDTVTTEDNTDNELVFAKNRDGFDQPVLKEELAPVVEGVIVVAEGARDIRTKRLLIDAVTTILGIPAHRVIVIPGNG